MSAGTSTPLRDESRTVLEILRRAEGAEVTYDQLRDAGVEFPASVVSELELAGVPVERGHGGRRHQQASCRLVESEPGVPSPTKTKRPLVPSQTGWSPVRIYGGHPRLNLGAPTLPEVSPGRAISALALLAAAVIVGFLVLSSMDTGASKTAQRARSTQLAGRALAPTRHITTRPPSQLSHRPSHHPAPPTSRPAPAPTPAAVRPSTPAALEARGHALLEAGHYKSAIPVLQQAIRATGENAGACAQPTGQNCLTYAYALFDLGHALRLGGNPRAAIPILKTRLQINNQRSVVAQELQLAESGAAA